MGEGKGKYYYPSLYLYCMQQYVELDGEGSALRFSACHFIPGHHKCSRLHGHDYFLKIKVYGRKEEEGMILDFSVLKEYAREILNRFDHRILIPSKSKTLKVAEKEKEVEIWVEGKHYIFPASDCVLCELEHTTAEALAEYICDLLVEKIKKMKNLEIVWCGISEGPGQTAWCERRLKP